MRAVIVVVVVFCFYCVVSCRPSYSLGSTGALVVVVFCFYCVVRHIRSSSCSPIVQTIPPAH